MPNFYSKAALPFAKVPYNFAQWQLSHNRFLRATLEAIPPSLAYLVLVESAKFHVIQLCRKYPSAISPDAQSSVKEAYQNMGCGDKNISFCNAGFNFPSTLTTMLDSKLVLFSCNPAVTKQELNELYAMAGHEALHTKENHALKSELAFFMTMEMMREASMMFLQVRAMVALCASVACAAIVFNEVNKRLEYRADTVSANRLHTASVLCGLFHRHPKESGPSHPSFESREANLMKQLGSREY
ncbi:MAG: hypothetical protein A3F13_07785 [Gammaproteobacteria bacterium RIFCSPHIGHO2_12_FULL_40_19]|nr:MAG: hypothetical protein A3F13_07785 [Gammaproteobacteria bacterium RIFCSPHIGHO2_12_FULL_40_19]